MKFWEVEFMGAMSVLMIEVEAKTKKRAIELAEVELKNIVKLPEDWAVGGATYYG